MRNPIYANIIASNIVRLHREFPEVTIGMHIANALDGSDLYNIADKDLAHAISQYVMDQELFDSYESDDSPVNGI